MEPTRGQYDVTTVSGYDKLLGELKRINESDNPVELVADLLLNGHEGSGGYLTFGNNKIAKNTGIFNMNSATDCPNAKSDENNQSETGVCQVPWDECYAHKAEKTYNNPLPKRRRQEYLWDNIDAVTFAKAFLRVKERKRSPFTYLRVSEAGDFRHRGDIIKWDRIAELVSPEIQVYTYSASHKLDWSHAEHFKVMASNGLADYGDNRYMAVPKDEDIPKDVVKCPYDETGIKCGECTMCINPDFDKDVSITLH